jgi:carboxyl-terminal processing protease
MPRRSLFVILALSVISLACYERADRSAYGHWFSEVLEHIRDDYVEPIDEQTLFEGALHGMVRKLDDYSSYMPRAKKTRFEEEIEQQYGGIGVEVSLEGPQKQITVLSPVVGGPAFKAGIRHGDRILAVDGRPTDNLPLDELVPLLRGKPGEAVSIRVGRDGQAEPLEFHLVRAVIKTESVLGDVRHNDGTWNYFLPGNARIGYVRIRSFGESTTAEFNSAMQWLAKHGCRGLIIDMRDNPGGLLQSAEQICDLFVPAQAVIVSTRGRQGESFTASGRGPFQQLPLVVLVNDNSASASEIVAACLQDHGRASVVGERTYGKGTVQKIVLVEGGKSLLKLTTASYWRPSGKNIQRSAESKEQDDWGVRPDEGCLVKMDDKQIEVWHRQRRIRDVTPTAGVSGADTQPAAPAVTSPLEFDPALRKACEVLDAKLGPVSKAEAA